MIKMYNSIINNDLMLSSSISIICIIIYYLENRRTNTPHNYNQYTKLLLLIFGAVYLVLYLKNKDITIKESNVKIGEPDF